MKDVASLPNVEQPHVVRLRNLAELDPADIDALLAAGRRASTFAARREIRLGATPTGLNILVRGWAAQVRNFRDGRRQILHLLLPGDMISVLHEPSEYSATSTLALTDVSIAPAPPARNSDSGLGRAYTLSAGIERICLLRQIARIGRLDAYERLADLFLEFVDRFRHAALAESDSFELPLTQETLADCLGLTSVHVNRMFQQMRREHMINDRGRTITLIDANRLRSLVDYQPLRTDCPGR